MAAQNYKLYVQCNRTKKEIAEKCRSKYWILRPLLSGISGPTVPISEFLQTFTGQNCWGELFLQCKYLSNVDINYITVITVKRAIIPFILITPQRSIGLTFAVLEKNGLYLPSLHWNLKKVSSMDLWDVIKLQIQIA